jgi:hypothetical protein
MKTRVLLCAGAAFVLSGFAPAFAADAGDPVYPLDMNEKIRAEVVYENVQRDVEFPSGEGEGEVEADAYYLRIHTDVGRYAYLDFDLGGLDPQAGNVAFYGGVGLRAMVYDGDVLRLGAFGQLHYAPNIEGEGDAEFDWLDGDAGFLVAAKLKLEKELTIIPYAGPVFSFVRLDGDRDVEAEESNPIGGAVGLSLGLPGGNGLRVEARIFDQVSFSVGASIAF